VLSTVWIRGLGFPEDPRWRDGLLWFSDFGQRVVRTADAGGGLTERARVAARPSGLGWLPDGTLLIVSMDDRRVLRADAGGRLEQHADLSPFAEHPCNDMVVSARGDAYVGHMGFDLFARPRRVAPASLLIVRPDGSASVAADDLLFPNGVVISPDGATMIVAETVGQRLTAFDVLPDGTLSGRRSFAELAGRSPDGICLDAEGAVWVADAASRECIRVTAGGKVTDVVTATQGCFACALGGADGRTLFLCTAEGYGRDAVTRNTGAIERIDVRVPAA
jgi:sugar lactone lactonase YvrE